MSTNIQERSRSASPPRKIYRACQHCVRSKTRCEGLSAVGGCARCRRRGTQCSLAGLTNLPESSGAGRSGNSYADSIPRRTHDGEYYVFDSQSTEIDQLKERIAQLESAYTTLVHSTISLNDAANASTTTAHLTTQLPNTASGSSVNLHFSSPTAGNSASAFNSPHSFNGYSRPPDIAAFKKALIMNPRDMVYNERSRCLAHYDGFPDMVQRGLATKPQVNGMFHMFKSQFSSISPMIPFLLTTRPIPTHPFILSAALTHITGAAPPRALIEESILYAMTGSAATNAIMALYILSFAPYSAENDPQVPISPLQIISLAYSIGAQIGLEVKLETALSGTMGDIIQPWAAERLEELALWEAIKLRFCILHIENSRCYTLPKLHASQFPSHPSEHVQHCLTHLQQLEEIILSCRDFIQLIAQSEVEAATRLPDMAGVHRSLNECLERLTHLKLIYKDSLSCLTFSLALRYTYLVLLIPAPISFDHVNNAQTMSAISLIPASVTLIDDYMSVVSEEVSIPYNMTVSFVICLSTSRRIVIMTRNLVPQPLFDEVKLSAAENYLANQPGLPGKTLREMWGDLDNTQVPAGEFEFNFDLFNFDFLDGAGSFPEMSSG